MDKPNPKPKTKPKSKKTTTFAQKQEKLFGKNSFELSHDGASLIVGSVLEKRGFSISESESNSYKPPLLPLPKPTLLPFPVARHRSHGPKQVLVNHHPFPLFLHWNRRVLVKSLYLHHCVESPIRLAAWNTLSNAFVLDLLPPMDKCVSSAEGYLYPVELVPWTKLQFVDLLPRLWLCIIFPLSFAEVCSADKQLLRNKIAKSVLRDFSQKQHHKEMILNLIHHDNPSAKFTPAGREDSFLEDGKMELRLKILADACSGNSSLEGSREAQGNGKQGSIVIF